MSTEGLPLRKSCTAEMQAIYTIGIKSAAIFMEIQIGTSGS